MTVGKAARKTVMANEEQESGADAVDILISTCITVCPACSGSLIEIRGKFHCSRCHLICETCCEGGRQ